MPSLRPILVVALNPAIDVEWRVDRVLPEEKNDVRSERRWPGGKGVNVARWLHLLGARVTLFAVVGGRAGSELLRAVRSWGIPVVALRLPGETRSNIIVTADAGGQWRFNHRGPVAAKRDLTRLEGALRQSAPRGGLVAFSGSRTAGLPSNVYAGLVTGAKTAGSEPILDCDGPAFADAVGSEPTLVKPNDHELAQWAGRALGDRKAIVEATWELSRATRGWVLTSLGAEGGLLVHASLNQAFQAEPPKIGAVQKTVGAGDASLAGALAQMAAGRRPEEWLRWAIATGTACVARPGGELPARSAIRELAARVRVRRVQGAGANSTTR